MLPARTRALCLTPLPCLHAHITYHPSSSSMLLLPGICTNTIVLLACSISPAPCSRSCGCVLTRHTFPSAQRKYCVRFTSGSSHHAPPHLSCCPIRFFLAPLLAGRTIVLPTCNTAPARLRRSTQSPSSPGATALDDSFITPYRRCPCADALSLFDVLALLRVLSRCVRLRTRACTPTRQDGSRIK